MARQPLSHDEKNLLPDNIVKMLYGKERHEYFMACEMLRCRTSNGEMVTKFRFRDLQKLIHGQTAAAEFECLRREWSTLREYGHLGIAIEHYGFDRALQIPLKRMFTRLHELQAPAWGDESSIPSSLLYLLEWPVSTGCCLHDAQKSIEWALHAEFQDAQLWRHCNICIEAFHKKYTLAQSYQPKILEKLSVFWDVYYQ